MNETASVRVNRMPNKSEKFIGEAVSAADHRGYSSDFGNALASSSSRSEDVVSADYPQSHKASGLITSDASVPDETSPACGVLERQSGDESLEPSSLVPGYGSPALQLSPASEFQAPSLLLPFCDVRLSQYSLPSALTELGFSWEGGLVDESGIRPGMMVAPIAVETIVEPLNLFGATSVHSVDETSRLSGDPRLNPVCPAGNPTFSALGQELDAPKTQREDSQRTLSYSDACRFNDFIRDQRDKTRLNVFLRVDLGDAGTVGAALRCSQKNYDVTFFADQKSVLNRLEAHAPELRRILDGVSHEFSRTDAKLAGSFVAFQDLRHADSGLRQSSFGEQRQERHPNRSPLNNPDANQSDKTGPIACLYYSNVSF